MPYFRVLGPTEVSDGDIAIDLGGPLPRRLCTALLAAEGHPVSDSRLIDAVWAGQPPADPVASLQVYASRLRRRLGAPDLLRRTSSGYQLRLSADATDVDQFTRALAEGRALLRDNHPLEALRVLDDALALWRGEPYADLVLDTDLSAARARLAESREVAIDERLAALLACGDAAGAIAELEAAVHADPYRERRWALLILGLYRAGRQRDALQALRQVRTLLSDELGIDPSPELQRLERQVLAQDPHLLLPGSPTPPPPRPLVPPLSSFLGREHDMTALSGLVDAHRLVTLVGPAGVGKTRLAVEYAAGRTEADGPWLVRLGDLTDSRVLLPAVAAALGLAETGSDPRARLTRALTARPGLLVLDNCEHLVSDVAALVLDLLGRCAGLRVLATSREPLQVDGEQILPVAPLPTSSAVTLLVDRIAASRPGWHPDTEDLTHARRLADALDGIPLALELAAARARVLGLRDLTEHLGDRFALLGRVPRGSLNAHATLEAAVAWSVDLLSTTDQALLWRLWPFEGGFAPDAVDVVRPAHGSSTVEALSSLVTRSVVVADVTVWPSRYRLLETVRAYCRAHDPDPAASLLAHACWVRDLVARCHQDFRGERSAHAMRLLTRELPNLRAAIEHDLRVAPAAALRTVGMLDWFWYRGGRLTEGQRVVRAALAAAPHAPPLDVARAWSASMILNFMAADWPAALEAMRHVDAALGERNDHEICLLRGMTRFYEAYTRLSMGQPDAALRAAAETVRTGQDIAVDWVSATGLSMVGAAQLALGRHEEGRATLRESISVARSCGQLWTAAYTELLLSRAMHAAGEPATDVLVMLRSALAGLHREDDVSSMLTALQTGVLVLASCGHRDRASRVQAAVNQLSARYGVLLGDAEAPLDLPDPDGSGTADQELISWNSAIGLVNDVSVDTSPTVGDL